MRDFDVFEIEIGFDRAIWACRCYGCGRVGFAPRMDTLSTWRKAHRAMCEMKRLVMIRPQERGEAAA